MSRKKPVRDVPVTKRSQAFLVPSPGGGHTGRTCCEDHVPEGSIPSTYRNPGWRMTGECWHPDHWSSSWGSDPRSSWPDYMRGGNRSPSS